MNIIPVIICGGAGTRLWPVSREAFPKPLLKLADGQSLLQKTFLRAARVASTNEVLIVTNRETYFLTKDECGELDTDVSRVGFVLEPAARNTAAAIGAAAEVVREAHGPDAIMLVMPADQLVEKEQAFAQAVQDAARGAANGRIVTFGIRPTAPETGYGYIEFEARPLPGAEGIHKVERFIEKPELNIAKELVGTGRHLWNAGMFCFTAQTMLDELQKHAPNVIEPTLAAVKDARRSTSDDGFSVELDAAHFGKAQDISIDYAVMERSSNVNVVPCDLGWNDIGSWVAISELTSPDESGNRINARTALHDVANCFVHALTDDATVNQRYPLCGPKVYTLRELVEYVGEVSGNRRVILSLPPSVGHLQAATLERLPGRVMSRDNLRSMEKDSVCDCPFPAVFGFAPMALEAFAPTYLSPDSIHSRFDGFRSSHSRR